MRILLGMTLALALLVAGCTSGGEATKATETTSAAPPTVDDTTGSIAGTVVDDEELPIAGVRVALASLNVETKTDEAGAFTFNGVSAGSQQVFFERLGYVSVARKVDVVVGEVASLTVVLKALEIGVEPYQHSDERSFYFNFAWYYVSRAVPVVNQSSLNEQTCSACVFHIPFQPGPKSVMTETHWVRSISQPGVNENIEPYYCIGWTVSCTVDGTLIARSDLNSREGFTWSESGAKSLAKLELVRLEVLAGFPGVMVQQKGTIWTSFAYLDSFPDGFTKLPPE